MHGYYARRDQLIDVPADKGLGVCMFSRGLYDRITQDPLDLSYVQVPEFVASNVVCMVRARTARVLNFARSHQLLSLLQEDFLKHLLEQYRFPIARILPYSQTGA